MLYRKCPICGAYLDPGERCDCQRTPPDPEPALPMPRRAPLREPRETTYHNLAHPRLSTVLGIGVQPEDCIPSVGDKVPSLEDDYVQRAWQRWCEV